jgi:hypothetical protein
MNSIINITLQELKDKSFEELVELYQNLNDGIIIKFRNFEKKYPSLSINMKIWYSKEYNEAFLLVSEAFFHHYNLLMLQKKINNLESLIIKLDDARVFFESCNIHISKINTHYLQPLTIKKANISINWGIASVVIGVIAIMLSVIYTRDTNMTNKNFDAKLTKQVILLKELKMNK